jgi:hypothetical protein
MTHLPRNNLPMHGMRHQGQFESIGLRIAIVGMANS